MFILGVTGPSGAGKSLAAARLAERGFAHVDADAAARAVVAPGSPCLKKLTETFGADILLTDGTLDRKKLASRAFKGGRLAELNAATHPFIIDEIGKELDRLKKEGKRHVVLDAPALYEAGADRLCDKVLAVTAPRELRLKRIMDRDGISQKLAEERLSAQPDDRFYTERSDYAVNSDGGSKLLLAAVDRVADDILGAGGNR